jgi:signal transduction histidine kinase
LLHDGISGTVREPSPIDGQMRIKAAHRITGYPALALATETEEAALADWRGIALLMSLGALGCAIAIAVAAFAFGRQTRQHAMLADAQAEIRRQEDLSAAFEEMRAAKEAAEMANLAKSEFLANMSHELRTPLNAVLGFSEMLVKQTFGPLGNERYRGYAEDIHASGSHLLGIINDILDLSKAASGTLSLVEEAFDAREVVNSMCRLIQPRIDEGKLTLVVTMPPSDLILYADERLLRQMLLNLLSNACKFTKPGGHIGCAVSVDADGVTFTVTDTGIGIPAQDLDRVLEPFAQVDSSLSRGQEGTGLGLALVKVMAELHGGRLRLASEIGRGTTASLIFPLARIEPAGIERRRAVALF